jgi:hypothetical protein
MILIAGMAVAKPNRSHSPDISRQVSLLLTDLPGND